MRNCKVEKNYFPPVIASLVVHMQEKETNMLIPKSRYQNVWRALAQSRAQSNEHMYHFPNYGLL